MRCFFIDPAELAKETPVVAGPDARHILDVLRLGPGDRIGLLDGSGNGYEAEITRRLGRHVGVVILGKFSVARESPVEIIVAQAMLKDKKMDILVRHLTELGITQWRPVVSERSVPRLQQGRREARVQRWEKIAIEAMKQCRRGRTPEIFAPIAFKELVDLDLGCDLKIAFWEAEAQGLSAKDLITGGRPPRRTLVLIGPEGGFSEAEMAAAGSRGIVTASLGPRILRAETAAIAAVSLVQHLFGDMG